MSAKIIAHPKKQFHARAAFKTVGCKLNQYETEAMKALFSSSGYELVPFETPADLYIINTCTVTSKSDRESRRLARQAARRNPNAKVIVTGCYAQRAPQDFAQIPAVSLILGNQEKPKVLEMLAQLPTSKPQIMVSDISQVKNFAPTSIDHFSAHTRAFLKIQDGCNERCAYCAVPLARGPSRSRPIQDILQQAKTLVDSGHLEIVLVGVDLGAYGLDLPAQPSLTHILRKLLTIPTLGRLRLSSIEPMRLPDDLIPIMSQNSKICRHLHLPLQSADDQVLQRMRRAYTAADYENILLTATKNVPEIALGADLIVGFPGETDEEFENTYDFVASLPFTYLHVFSYSPRPGTPAAQMPPQIPEPVKKERSHRLRELSLLKQMEFRKKLLATKQQVLVETITDPQTNAPTGLTDNYVRVSLPPQAKPGTLIEVEITKVQGVKIEGRLPTKM